MQLNRGRPRTGIGYKIKTISYPKEFEIILKQVKEWDSKICFSKEFVKAIRKRHKKILKERNNIL
jgi:hypothetical protein